MMAASDDRSKPSRSKEWGLNDGSTPELDPQEQKRVVERNQLIVKVMEINAKQRHAESLHLGVKLELDHAKRTLSESDSAQVQAAEALEVRFKELTDILEKLVAERDFLEVALAEIDSAPLPKTGLPGRGHA